MKKALFSFLILFLMAQGASAQEVVVSKKGMYKRQQAIGISFVLNDYQTADRIRSSSLASVIGKKQTAKFNEMSPGLGLSYFRGLNNNIDFAGTVAGSFIDNPRTNSTSGGSGFLAEVDASVQLKMFSDQYWFTPYLSAGVGASKYRSYYGAIMPLGGGFKINLFNEAAIFLNAQYRIPITTETNNYHMFYNIGIAGIIGNKGVSNP